jgi:hypothetical protein
MYTGVLLWGLGLSHGSWRQIPSSNWVPSPSSPSDQRPETDGLVTRVGWRMVPQSGNGMGSGNPHKDEGGLSSVSFDFLGYVSGQSYSFVRTYMTCLSLFRIFEFFWSVSFLLFKHVCPVYPLWAFLSDFMYFCSMLMKLSPAIVWTAYHQPMFFFSYVSCLVGKTMNFPTATTRLAPHQALAPENHSKTHGAKVRRGLVM